MRDTLFVGFPSEGSKDKHKDEEIYGSYLRSTSLEMSQVP
jgi:hypothetical protein